jgi:hypothetical protein
MKKEFYLMICAVLGFSAAGLAQAQNPECMTNLSIYAEHAKVKNYDAAYAPWKMVYENCPAINKANFSLGERILSHKIENSTGAEKDKYVQELMSLYDNSIKHFPTKYSAAEIAIDKSLLKYDNKMASDAELYQMLDKAFKEDSEHFTNPKALYLYFSSLVDLHNAGQKELQDVFDTYDDVTEKIEMENKTLTDQITKLLPKEDAGTLTKKEESQLRVATTNSESYGKIASSIDSKLGALADCSNLIPLYQKSFDQKKDDIKWVKRAVGRMFGKECTDDPLFRKLFEAQLALEPSASAEAPVAEHQTGDEIRGDRAEPDSIGDPREDGERERDGSDLDERDGDVAGLRCERNHRGAIRRLRSGSTQAPRHLADSGG